MRHVIAFHIQTYSALSVIRDTHLLSFFHPADAADNDFVTSLKCDHLSSTVRGTGVIDISEEANKTMFYMAHEMLSITVRKVYDTGSLHHLILNKHIHMSFEDAAVTSNVISS